MMIVNMLFKEGSEATLRDKVAGIFAKVMFWSGIYCAMLLFVFLKGGTVHASESATDLTQLGIEELMNVEVYSASKFEQKVTEAPSSVSVVTSDDIRKYGYRTLADILRSLRSFYITYDRNYSYAGVRGFGRSGDYNTRILLLVDGHRLNDNVYEGALIGTEFPVDVDLIARVEVIRGPGSSLYGSNAFFAVINVITKRGTELKGFETSGEIGSFKTNKGRITYGDRFKNGVEMFLSGSAFDSSGQKLFFREFDAPETNNGLTDHTDYDRSYNTIANLSYLGFTLEGVYSSRTKGIPTGSYGTDFNDRRNRTTDAWWFVDLKYEHNLRSGLDITGRLFCDNYEYRGDYLYSGVVNKDSVLGKWWGGEIKLAATMFERHKLIIGSEYRDNISQDQKNYTENPYELLIDERRKSQIWAFYIQDEFAVLRNLILNAGIRYDHYSTFGNTVNPRLALIYKPFEKTIFKLLYGSAFRAPNVYEFYYESLIGLQKANPGLQPERIKTYELIYEQYLGNNLKGSVSGFYYKIDDLISMVIDPADNMSVFRNIGKVEGKGVELELEGKLENGLSGKVSYTFQDTRDITLNQTLSNSPKHVVKLNVVMQLLREKVFLGLEEQFTGSRKTLVGNSATSYYVTNFTLFSQGLLKKFEASVSVYNLFDYKYGDPGAIEHVQDVIEQDGRAFRFKATYRF